ncbi:hypothetical protein NDU88_003935 [Pleurodeles waltl]|uniref:Uncharacterized protein n=1 Tax=Pleurodeles waltl TaxID=8319 RepID=A0AAV7QE32_PLEWA|nr:hypothetical protein NDU88_003935 [Pleurodeles waltl]
MASMDDVLQAFVVVQQELANSRAEAAALREKVDKLTRNPFDASASTPQASLFLVSMDAYDDQGGDEYYVDDPVKSFEHDLVYALDAGVRHTVNQALAQAVRHIKHHLIGFAEQQGWVAPSGAQAITEPSLSGSSQALKQGNNPHAADFESLIRSLTRDHDYNAVSSQKSKSKEDLADHSSD